MWQTLATLLGLSLDIVGVVLVGKEWVVLLHGGVQRLLKAQTALNLRAAKDEAAELRKLAEVKGTGGSLLKMLVLEVGLAFRRLDGRIYNGRVERDRKKAGLPPMSVLTAEDYRNVDAISRHDEELSRHYRELVAEGTPNPSIAMWGFAMILAGFVLQFTGALPL